MDAATLTTIESILGSMKDLAPHLRELNLASIAGLSRGGGGTLGPIILLGGVAVAAGVGAALLLAPQSGAELWASLRKRANALSSKIQAIATSPSEPVERSASDRLAS
jgi:hypothetical protein